MNYSKAGVFEDRCYAEGKRLVSFEGTRSGGVGSTRRTNKTNEKLTETVVGGRY